jgi:hypothetical protein
MVPRVALDLLTEAWAESPISISIHVVDDVNTTTMPPLPCILWAYGTATPPQLLSKRGLGRDMKIKPGTHDFVKMAGESSLRVSRLACAFGEAMGHPQMSGEQPVEAAGEVEIDAEGQLVSETTSLAPTRSPSSSHSRHLPQRCCYATPPIVLSPSTRCCCHLPECAAVSHAHDSALALAAGGTWMTTQLTPELVIQLSYSSRVGAPSHTLCNNCSIVQCKKNTTCFMIGSSMVSVTRGEPPASTRKPPIAATRGYKNDLL